MRLVERLNWEMDVSSRYNSVSAIPASELSSPAYDFTPGVVSQSPGSLYDTFTPGWILEFNVFTPSTGGGNWAYAKPMAAEKTNARNAIMLDLARMMMGCFHIEKRREVADKSQKKW